ncbi:MAG: sigma-70 family RNA polymerase sigma factor [Bryobacterales bacterium]|nr:sigma-70 family RNA polymerase sigma factor [Bryobacterales bacterium]
MDQDESKLLDSLRANRAGSFETLLERYGPRLMATAARMLGNAADAEDVVQDSLIAAWKGVGGFEGSSSLYTWLHRIVVNQTLARMRTARWKAEANTTAPGREASPALEALPSAWAEPGIPFEKRLAMRRAIQHALESIPEELKAVLLLRDVEEMSSKEVADQLGVSDALVRQRLHRARTAMAELLRPELCDGPELTCGGQFDLLMDYIDQCLPEHLQAPVHQHLETCVPCGDLLRTYRMSVGLPRAILSLTAADVLPPGFVERTSQRAAAS